MFSLNPINSSLLSSQIDFARRNSKNREHNRLIPIGLTVVSCLLGTSIWLSFGSTDEPTESLVSAEEVLVPKESSVIASKKVEKAPEVVAAITPKEIKPTPVATVTPAAVNSKVSPIVATNMATTLFYGPPQKFEILPPGKVTEVTVKSGDTLAIILNRLGFSSNTLHEILEQNLAGAELQKIYPGQKLTFVSDTNGLKQIRYPYSDSETFIINKNKEGVSVDLIERPREVRTNYATAEIDDSLYMAAKDAGIDSEIVMELAEVFEYDVDFYLDIKRGDSFKVMYEEYYVDGEKVGNGPILAAEFTNQDKSYEVVRYKNKNGNFEYYRPSGLSLRKAFIRSPVEYARISSPFNLNRMHPILHKIRAHKGTDYSAPRGTPIRSTGDGKVIYQGRRGGYGNVVEIQHGTRYRTLYAHMNGFAKNLKTGSAVEQGQIIGYVGSTGLASGPHLHYEFKVDGVHKDPVKLDLPMADPLSPQEKKKFMLHASNMMDQLERYDEILLAEATPKSKTRDRS